MWECGFAWVLVEARACALNASIAAAFLSSTGTPAALAAAALAVGIRRLGGRRLLRVRAQ